MNLLGNIYHLYANMDKNSKFLLYMIILIIFLLILIVIISIISRNKELKQRKILLEKRKELKKSIKENIKPLDFSDLDEDETVTQKSDNKIEKLEKIEEIKEENENTEIIEVMDESVDDEIENIKKSIENNIDNNPINLNKWEQEQEKSAIISYDELVKRAGAKKIIYKSNKKKEEVEKKSSFKPSKIVSPIYGVQNNEIKKMDKEIDNFSRIEKLKIRNNDEEMDNDVEFLNKLKKFRNELN